VQTKKMFLYTIQDASPSKPGPVAWRCARRIDLYCNRVHVQGKSCGLPENKRTGNHNWCGPDQLCLV